MCGDNSITWNDFEVALARFRVGLRRIGKTPTDPDETDDVGIAMVDRANDFLEYIGKTGAARLIALSRKVYRSDEATGRRDVQLLLSELIWEMPAFEAERSHDLIYALLSLARDTRGRVTSKQSPTHALGDSGQGVPSYTEALCASRQLGGLVSRTAELRPWASEDRIKQAEETFSSTQRSPLHSLAFEVNYSLDFLNTCQQLLSAHMLSTPGRGLDILCRPWAPRQETKLPSWIPAITQMPFEMDYKTWPPDEAQSRRQNHDPLVGENTRSGDPCHYNARGSLSTQLGDWTFGDPSDPQQRQNLFVAGFELDSIDLVTASSSTGDIPMEWFAAANVDLVAFHADAEADERLLESLITTLLAPTGIAPYSFALLFAAFRDLLRISITGLETNWLLSSPHALYTGDHVFNELRKRLEAVVFNRRLIRSTRLKQLGLVPKHTKPGDRICILKSCSVPVVLRRHTDKMGSVYHELIGECYLHEMMQGEAIEEQETRHLPFQRFELR